MCDIYSAKKYCLCPPIIWQFGGVLIKANMGWKGGRNTNELKREIMEYCEYKTYESIVQTEQCNQAAYCAARQRAIRVTIKRIKRSLISSYTKCFTRNYVLG